MKKAKKMKCYKRLIHKQSLQVSGLCGSPFLSYLPKRLTQLYRALYGVAMLVYHLGTPMATGSQQKTSGIHFYDASAFFSLVS